ncbi:MAG: hypothetical protein EOP02_23830, partial [Proteobacteria bacterium]
MNNVLHLAVLYGVFAAIATMVNIGCQALVIGFYQDSYAVPISILVGTAAALPVKYLLEKRHIFNFKSIKPTCHKFVVGNVNPLRRIR